MSDFFRLGEQEQFRFYRLPKALFLDDEYSDLSADAKLLYGVLYDRMELSRLNKWTDEYGRVFIYFTVKEASKLLGFGHDKTSKLFAELEAQNLILRHRRGCGKADVIYPKKVRGKSDFFITENPISGKPKTGSQEIGKSDANDTEIKDTDSIETYLSSEEMERRIRAQIEYDVLCEKESAERIDEIVSIIGQVLNVRSPTMTICGCEYATDFVKRRFHNLTDEHIEYVLDCMDANKSKIKNVSAYLIAALFNAPTTIDSYYRAEVNHDMAAWCNA